MAFSHASVAGWSNEMLRSMSAVLLIRIHIILGSRIQIQVSAIGGLTASS
jgi:hypothetical protein